MRRLPTLAAAALAALLCAQPLAPLADAAEQTGFTVRREAIPGAGGVTLDAKVVEPAGPAREPRPLLVMPASWAVPNIEYLGAASGLVHDSGYVVVTYTARGFYASEGEVEVAGPEDVADASRVIDWAVSHTSAGAENVGMAGISYGAGISVLTAAEDPRVDAVAAMSGWADLAASLYPNDTVSAGAAELLLGIGHVTGRFGEDLRELERAYREHRTEDALHLAPERSPANRVEELNENGTAVLLANAWQDSFFPPKQITDLFGALNGPKRLMLAPGDHATPEAFGAAGLPNRIWERATEWFDRHLRGVRNDLSDSAVELEPLNGSGWREYPSWEAVTTETGRFRLTEPVSDGWPRPETGELVEGPASDWQHRIDVGDPTLARSGTVMLSGLLQGFARVPVGVSVPLVDRDDAAVWSSEPLPSGGTVSGTPRLRLSVTPTGREVSLFAHLYEVGPLGKGSLITHKPITVRNNEPGVPSEVDLALQPVVWNVSAGNRLVLVVDTVDARYREEGRGSVAFGSSSTAPAELRIPFG
ncbi:CocE/NonD family hydrolase [Actinopolyspora mortivallis]|uniref:X-Pro dipeptidyl-peptidase n=1 Tax=Actinopolyspora mortivallis TaxID=33906 RepID=A0A2T0GX45_ACTMO|nr:CocE/NonD family hydrolase [Actinopolyspora mortivallis]PRW63593.1 X-Pro dipeptidyl-peptidase [Actinopolyspora mortivallis]